MAVLTLKKYADGTDTGWKSLVGQAGDTKPFNGTIWYRRIGRVCEVCGYGLRLKQELNSGTSITLVEELVSGDFLPPINLPLIGGSRSNQFSMLLTLTGNLVLYRSAGQTITTDDNINFNFMYFGQYS